MSANTEEFGSVCHACARFLDNPERPGYHKETMSFLKDMFLKRHHSPIKWVSVKPTATVWLEDMLHNCNMCGMSEKYLFMVEVAW